MVVQCPECQAKFNLADGKVTEKGLKVRCSKCKNIFEVKKEAASSPEVVVNPKPAEEEEKFSFGEDFDFGDEKVSTERAPQPPPKSNFDFSDGVSSTPPPAPPAPRAPEPPKKETEEFSFEDEEADFSSSEEFGSESKQPDLGMSPEMPEIPGSGSNEAPDGGEASLNEGLDDFKIDRGSEIPARGGVAGKPAKKGAPAEEFDFADKLESYARPEAPARGKDELGDDLEAQIDIGTESAPATVAAATAQVREFRAPSRPAPVTYREKRGGGFKVFLILVLSLILLSPVGGLFYLNSTGSFTFSDLAKKDFAKLKSAPEVRKMLISLGLAKPELQGEIAVLKEGVSYQIIKRRDGGDVASVQGKVRNDWPVAVAYIKVEVTLYDADRNALTVKTGFADLHFEKSELQGMSQEEIEGWMNTRAGRNTNNMTVPPKEERDFAVVFFQIPPGVANYDVTVKNFEMIKGGG